MSVLKYFKPKPIFEAYKVLIATQARQAHFLVDFQPGPYPKTKEEKEAAARKYYLLPEEYEPIPENEVSVGDYPKLPLESVYTKNPYHPWDMPEIRKDYCDAIPREMMMLLPEGISTEKTEFTPLQCFFIYLSLVGTVVLFILFLDQWKFEYPVCEKQYPTPGVTHYTFDRLSDEEWEKLKAENRMKECIEKCKNPDL